MTDCAQGRYRLIRKIGQGGMGTVYLAYDRKLNIERVVKEVRFKGRPDDEKRRQQFVSEMNIIREIQHPCIPRVVDLFSEGGALMIVMERIEGKDLKKQILDQGSVPVAKAVDWGIQLAQILIYLHGKDPPIFHRDLKPENVILHPSGRLYLIDFGIAGGPAGCSGQDEFKGTYGYAAPEQYVSPVRMDGRGDIYSLGRLLNFCLFGDPSGTEGLQTPGDKMPEIPDSFRAILRKCTESDPGKRYQRVDKLLEDLTRLKGTGFSLRIRVRRHSVWIFAGILVLILAGRCAGRAVRGREAAYLLELATETPDPEKKRIYYHESLKKAPWKESIYKDMLDTYVLPNHFSSREAVSLINILQDAGALPVLKKQNPEAYARFCYDLGIGYFYQMGGGVGKMESAAWFRKAENMGRGLTSAQLGRASCYGKIGKYYRSFLHYGQNRNREEATEDFEDFFKTLEQLAVYSLEHSGEADQSSAWYAAYEVAEEIRDYAGEFLKEDEITGDSLRKELEKIETFMSHLSDDVDENKKNQLAGIVAEAKKRVEVMEANYEKQYRIRMPDDSSDHPSDTGTVPKG